MAGPHRFEIHLFISYAHLDNQPMVAEHQGWVSRFHASLEAMLSMRMGRKAEIWRDRKLSGNDIFADEIIAQFPKTALLISVLTPRYVESDWCTREVREFCRLAEKSGGVVVENKSRVIKVIKMPVESEDPLPPIMKDALGYPFFIFDDEHTPLELDPAYGPDMAPKYNLKVAKLAWDVTQQLKQLEAAAPDKIIVTEPVLSKATIYLAECSWDLRPVREALETDFRLHGYSILPDCPLPRDEAGYVAEVARLLAQSKFSIHLVGAGYGAVPDGPTQKSVVILQNEMAIEASKKAGLRRVIWLAEGTETQQTEQLRFIETLNTSAEAQFGADFLICDLETLKGAVHSTLEKMEKPVSSSAPSRGADGGERFAYLICDEKDRKATIPLRKLLKVQGLDVQIPVFEGDSGVVRQNHQDLLAQCDAVIIFYGAGDESWKRTVDSDLRKIKGYRGEKPLSAVYTYLAPPATSDKEDLIEMEEPNLVNGLAGFSEPDLQPLLQTLKPDLNAQARGA